MNKKIDICTAILCFIAGTGSTVVIFKAELSKVALILPLLFFVVTILDIIASCKKN